MKLDRGLLVLDVETTGTDPETSSIIQIGVIRLSNELDYIASFQCYVKPYTSEWTEQSQKIHNLSKEFLQEKGLDIKTALEELEKFVMYKFKDYYIAQWSSSFDISMLKSAYKKAYEGTDVKFPYSYRAYDIASFVRLYLASLNLLPRKRVSLKDCAEILKIDVDNSNLHDALYDASLTSDILIKASKSIHSSLEPARSLCLLK